MKAIYYMACKRLFFIKICFVFIFITQCSFAQTVQRLTFASITEAKNTGQDYSPWLSDDVNVLVQSIWSGNLFYDDVVIKLANPGKITSLSLYDGQGVFIIDPACIYAVKNGKKKLLTKFTGPGYMVYQNKSFAIPIDADSLIVHKYANNIPQKILVYGYPNPLPVVITPPPVATPPVVQDSLVKIPITPSRWYQLDNVSNGLDALTDGVTDVDVNTGYGKLIANYDACYPVANGEAITLSKVKFFSYQGGLDQPMTLSIINSKGKRITVGTFKGFQYNTWVGPYPDRGTTGDGQFNLDSTLTDIKYIVINSWSGFPTEMELYGTYTPPTAIAPLVPKPVKMKQFFGVNAFEWNFENGAIDPTKIDSASTKAVKSFSQIRHYMDWQKLEATQGSYTFNPTHDGGWNYDAIYQYCKTNNIDVLADLKEMPSWMVATYPDSIQDAENVPLVYGRDFTDPNSYIEQAKIAFQYAARYGFNASVDSTQLSVDTIPRWTADPVNSIKKGLGLIKYIECDNERDKWWKGRKAYQTSYEYAANLSAFYDGNKNTMGPGVGVKNADASMMVVMGGLASADPGYVRGMIDWCKQHRGYKADGSVNLCWDIINYHLYSNDSGNSQNGVSTTGVAPEYNGSTAKTARAFMQMAHGQAGDMPVWVTELGYDLNQGSPVKAPPIGDKTAAQTQADWILRSSLLYARNGIQKIFFYEMYDDNAANPTQFASSGLINDDKTRRPAADYLYQTNKLLGEYTYKETLNSDPLVDHYDLNGQAAYALMVPDQTGRTATYALDLPGIDSAKVYSPKIGADSMTMVYVKTVAGKLNLTVTETPMFVIPVPGSALSTASLATPQVTDPTKPAAATVGSLSNSLKLYPNPSAGYVNVAFTSPDVQSGVTISILNEQTGKIYKTVNAQKSETDFSQLVDMSSVTTGVYLIQVKQGNNAITKKVIRVN